MDIVSTAAAPIANLIALYMGFASVGMALAATVVQLLLAPISIGYCFRELKLRPRFVRLPGALVREMLGFSVFVFIGTLVDMLFWATDKVILGMLASTVAVAVYNVGGTFNNIVMQLSTSISGVLVPRITGMVATRPRSEWSELFIRIGRIQFLIIALILTGFSVFGRQFIDLWADPSYADAYWVALLTLYPLSVPLIQSTAKSFVIAQNKHQFRAIVYLIIAIANVISTYLIVPYMGIIGAALCSCVSYLLGQGIIMNIYYYKVTGLDIPRFWGNILRMAIIPAGMMIVGLSVLKHITLNSWLTFLLGVVIYSGIYALLMYRFAMNDYEKDIIRKPIQKILRRLSR
jgi:O-antigen/teichoic acid export membrane protein